MFIRGLKRGFGEKLGIRLDERMGKKGDGRLGQKLGGWKYAVRDWLICWIR